MPATLPLKIRRLRATMELKGLSLEDVEVCTGIPYAVASRLLNNKLDRPERFATIAHFIKTAPMPEKGAK